MGKTDIRKADSKGRVTGFKPGQIYVFDRDEMRYAEFSILAPDGEPVEDALREAIMIDW